MGTTNEQLEGNGWMILKIGSLQDPGNKWGKLNSETSPEDVFDTEVIVHCLA